MAWPTIWCPSRSILRSDNIGIEIYCDRPSIQWKWEGSKVRMATVSLDTEDLLRELTASGWKADAYQDSHRPCSPPCSKPCKSYEVLSRNPWVELYGNLSWRFFCPGKYHHHIATNIWLGTSIQLASSEFVGLNHFGIELPNNEPYEKTTEQLRKYRIETLAQYGQSNESSKSVFLSDMDGITIRLYSR